MRQLFWIHLLSLFFAHDTCSQSVSPEMGGRAAGLAYATATIGDEWSMLNNPGGLGEIKKPAIALAAETRPELQGAGRVAVTAVTNFRHWAGGVAFFRFGDEVYNEQIASLGAGNQFGITSLGIRVNAIQYSIPGFATRRALSASFGGIARLTPHVITGACINNINQPILSGSTHEHLPTQLCAGIAFTPSGKFTCMANLFQDLGYKPMVKLAGEYLANTLVTARAGLTLNPDILYFGFGVGLKKIKFDYAFQFGSTLGTAHQISMVWK